MQKSRCENRHDFLLRSVPLYPKILAAAAPRRRVMNSRRPIISVDSLRLGISLSQANLPRAVVYSMTPVDPLPPSAIQSSCVAVFLFDQLVRAQQDRCRHIEAKRLGGLHIEHGLVFRSNFARSSAAISLAKA
jgi:hypothetical protein